MARGDHIKVRRRGGIYSHHGIDMGDGTVIHFSGEPFRRNNAQVCRATLEEFLAGGQPHVVRHRGTVRPPEDVARAAESCLSQRAYCLWRNNCEHFATWCKTGRHHSGQVLRALHVAGGVMGATVALLVPLLVARRGSRRTV